jgi:hypothetical protein
VSRAPYELRARIVQNTRIFGSVSVALVASALCVSTLLGQTAQRSVAELECIKQEVGGGRDVKSIKPPVSSVRIDREATIRPAGSDQTLRLDDRLLVSSGLHVQVKVDRANQAGRMVFFPQIRNRDLDEELSGSTLRVGQGAEYRLLNDPFRPGNTAVDVVRGSLVARWTEGRLTAYVANNPVSVLDAKVLVKTSSDGERGIVFLGEGTVVFPLARTFRMRPGQAVEVDRNRIVPTLLTLSPDQTAALRGELEHNEGLCGGSIWSQPLLYVGIGAGAVLGGVLGSGGDGGGGNGNGNGGPETVSGTVTGEPIP